MWKSRAEAVGLLGPEEGSNGMVRGYTWRSAKPSENTIPPL